MIRRTSVAGALLAVSCVTWVTQPVKTSYPTLVSKVANFGPGCRVKLSVPIGAEFPVTYGIEPGTGGASLILTSPPFWYGEWFLGFTCYSQHSEQAKDDLIARRETDRRWVEKSDGSHINPAMRFTIYNIETRSAIGWSHTTDDTAVAEERAERLLRYCVYHNDRAICGGSTVGSIATISRHPRADRTAYVLKILRSIEFLDDAPPDSAQPSK
jgi:hypothetical protein